MNAIGARKINGVNFTFEVMGASVKITTNVPTSLEDIFSAAEEIIKENKVGNPYTATAYFDEMGDLIVKEKGHGHKNKITKRYNLDRQMTGVVIPLAHIFAYGYVSEFSAIV